MLSYIRGKVLEHDQGRVTVLFSPSANSDDFGIGYDVHVPTSQSRPQPIAGEWIELHLYTHVREDALELYGFESPKEKQTFLDLLSVSGIGPKGAMGIISNAGAEAVSNAIVERNQDALVALPGIGKKTAERLILELADKLGKRAPGTAASGKHFKGVPHSAFKVWQEAKEALVQLGFRESEIIEALKSSTTSSTQDPPKTVEQMVREALGQLRG